jgi:hypothetical protein
MQQFRAYSKSEEIIRDRQPSKSQESQSDATPVLRELFTIVAFFPLRKIRLLRRFGCCAQIRLLRTGVLPNFGVSDGLMEVATCDTAAHQQQDSPEGPTRDESGYQTRRWVQSVGAVKVGKSLTMAFVSSSLSECVCESSGVRDLGGLKSARRSLIKLGRS